MTVWAARLTVAAAIAAGLAGCGGDDATAAPTADNPLSDATYYKFVAVGDLAEASDEDLTTIGQALCGDLRSLDNDEDRRAAWVLLNEQTDREIDSLAMVLAITGRYCPEYFHLWDEEVEEIMGGDLPWQSAS